MLEENIIETPKDQKLSSTTRYELSTLTNQKENNRFFFIPREWIYFQTIDTSNFFERWAARRIAEPPSIYREQAAEKSAVAMRNYLISKGYYAAKVEYEPQFYRNDKKVKVYYQVRPQQQYLINKAEIKSPDKNLEATLEATRNRSLLKRGEVISLEKYNNEATRIVNYLRNNGYATFNRSYIAPLQADSAKYKVDVRLEILLPPDSSWHKSYRVGRVEVFTDYDPLDVVRIVDGEPPIYEPRADTTFLQDTVVQNIHFYQARWKNKIKANHLAHEIRLRPGQKYNLSSENQTNINLNSLGVFRFISIKSEIDSLRDTIINYKIYLTRNQRIGFGTNLNFSYSDQNITQTRLNLIGLTSSVSLKLRNALKGAELLTNSVSFGMEFETIPRVLLNTIDVGVQSQLDIPRFTDYMGLWKWIGRKEKEGSLYNFLADNANTRIQLSYNFLDRRRFYNYQLFNLSFGYTAQLKGKHQLDLQHFGINYFNPSVDEGSEFENLLFNNPFLQRSFGQQFFTGALLRKISYFYNSRNISRSNAYAFNANMEFSGAEVHLLNSIYNSFALQEDDFSLGDIDFSRYAVLELDGRYYKYMAANRSLATRFTIGIGLPFGQTEEVPYVKQFFIGGPNSIRAFRAREVGPGSYCSADIFSDACGEDDVPPLNENTPFYQTGNFKLELNAEYRFDLFKISDVFQIEGALFADAGNVWLTKFDEDRPNAQFRFTPKRDDKGLIINEAFYRQIALGTGFGFRMDISYVLIRFDLGYPLHTPYEPSEAWINGFTSDDINYNLALNYPF